MGLRLDYSKYNLRPLDKTDAEMILEWRNDERIRAYMYTDHIISFEEHSSWIEETMNLGTRYYYIFELDGVPVGNVGFYNINYQHSRAEWNFHLMPEGVPKGTGAAMEFFALDRFFNEIEIKKLLCEVIDFNKGVVKLHKRFGFEEEGLRKKHVFKNNMWCDVYELAIFSEQWAKKREQMFLQLFA